MKKLFLYGVDTFMLVLLKNQSIILNPPKCSRVTALTGQFLTFFFLDFVSEPVAFRELKSHPFESVPLYPPNGLGDLEIVVFGQDLYRT